MAKEPRQSPPKGTLLSTIQSPADCRQLTEQQLPQLAQEMRDYLIQSLDISGGHFAANLGTIELAIALHTVYDTPNDRLIWDVGHQAYPHKMLTGRLDQLTTIRQPNGLAPFPKREESEYDTFGTGHSSTSISAGLGMAMAAKLSNEDRRTVAIIGDGGLTGGMAFEALNHAGALDPNFLVILNDNDMSISENVGALTHYLGRILSSKLYTQLREGGKQVLSKLPPVSRLAKKTESQLKNMVVPGTLFEELGFQYIGPIDGHDLPTLIQTLKNIQGLSGAKLLHVITKKGKGYPAAEANPIKYHAVKPEFHSNQANTSPSSPTFSDIFGEWLCDMATHDDALIGITPAMCEGSGMQRFQQEHPDRYFDVGIAEQHALTFAAGLACEGKKPVVAIYSTFLQRAYDQLIHDIALQNLNITLAIDRAGLVGSDGPTHAGSFDIAFMRCIPNLIIMAPTNEQECREMLTTAYRYPGPAAVRYPRGCGPGVETKAVMTSLPVGKGLYCLYGKKVAILAFGCLLQPALEAGKTLEATVINMRFVKPIDTMLIKQVAKEHDLIVTIEDHAITGGAGSAVNEYVLSEKISVNILNLGLPDRFIEHGIPAEMYSDCGLDKEGILRSIRKYTEIS